MEKSGFSNNSIEQQQIKQLKQDELQEEQIRRMHTEQEQKMKQMELIRRRKGGGKLHRPSQFGPVVFEGQLHVKGFSKAP